MQFGINGGPFNFLSQSDIEKIHHASLELLFDPGIQCESDSIMEVFRRAGAPVSRIEKILSIPEEMVVEALRLAPKQFTLYGRDRHCDLKVENGQVYFGMGGASEPLFWDYSLGRARAPTKADMVRCTRLGDRLENVDFILALCSSGDMPPEAMFLHDYDAIMRNTVKPVVVSAPGREMAERMVEMACVVSGGEQEFRLRPWLASFVTPTAPLRSSRLDECLFVFADWGIPALIRPGPMMGATAPAALAAELAQTNAEALFGVVLAQLIRPGTPVIYGPASPAMDMTTTLCTYGSPDESVGRAAIAQIGRAYGLPTWNTAATEAKLPDAQAAAEAMFGMLLNALACTTFTQTMGTLASGFYGAAEMLVICDEMARMIKYALRGIQVSDDTLALDVIRETSHRGNFLTHAHTARTFRQELYFPALFKRLTIDQWESNGSRNILEQAHVRVEQILAGAMAAPLPEGADEALHALVRRD